jgi:hypothetical protein
MTAKQNTPANWRTHLTTEELAALFGAAPQTPRASLCRIGHWMGMRPVKLPNGRLLWNAAEAERLASGGVVNE